MAFITLLPGPLPSDCNSYKSNKNLPASPWSPEELHPPLDFSARGRADLAARRTWRPGREHCVLAT